jgi:Zn-dependent protease
MFIETLSTNPRGFFAVVLAIVVSVCLHELAHGLVAIWLGDRTPLETGHITLNPLVHMGWMSILAMLMAGIAWGAMPVDRRRLRGKHGDALVSAAGPATNILIAAITLVSLGLWWRFDTRSPDELSQIAVNAQYLLQIFGGVNVLLAIFNLIPLPPLDGSGIMRSLVPAYREQLDRLNQQAPGAVPMIALVTVYLASSYIALPARDLTTFILEKICGSPLVLR